MSPPAFESGVFVIFKESIIIKYFFMYVLTRVAVKFPWFFVYLQNLI